MSKKTVKKAAKIILKKILKKTSDKSLVQSIMALLVSLFLSACADKDLPESSDLVNLRILGFKIDTSPASQRAEFTAGETLTLTPIVSDLPGSGLEFHADACIDPGVAYGAEPTCDGNASKVELNSGFTGMTLPSAANSYTGFGDSFTVTLPAESVLFANRSDAEKFNGVSYLVVYTLKSSNAYKYGFTRLLVSTKSTKNLNPDISSINANGSALSSYPFGQVVNLSADLAVGAEAYQVQNQDGSFSNSTESVITSWYISDGDVNYLRTDSAQPTTQLTTAASAPSGRKTFVIAIARDNRGGSDAVIFSQ
jgi:hypothetical protein